MRNTPQYIVREDRPEWDAPRRSEAADDAGLQAAPDAAGAAVGGCADEAGAGYSFEYYSIVDAVWEEA